MKQGYIYILTNNHHTTLYIGVTSNLVKRVYEHKNHFVEGFTKQYNVDKFIYYEIFPDIIGAIQREKQIKKWNRAWKNQLINVLNPTWRDLYQDICL